MSDPSSGGPLPDRPDAGRPPEQERSSGLLLEHCYRHPNETTGVHCTRCGRPICPDCMRPASVGYQCPDCAAEAQRSGRRPRIRVRFLLGRPGFWTTSLLAINIAVFVAEVALGGGTSALFGGPTNAALYRMGALFPPSVALQHQYWRLVTVMFLHGSILHIALNMYALYLFGYLIENTFGWRRFLSIYLVAGFLASVTSFAFGPVAELGVGASGAIFGLLGAWVAFNYRRRQMRLNRANLQGAYLIIILNVILGFSIPGIDWRAHLGGLVGGVLAGVIADGIGPDRLRPVTRVVGFGVLVVAGVAVTAWRVATFPAVIG